SMPATASAASCRYLARAASQSRRAGMERTSAPGVMGLPLLEVFFDPFRLAEQERDVQVGRLDEPLEDLHGVLELLAEAVVLLVPPGVAEGEELGVQAAQVGLQVGVEPLEVEREPPQFRGIDDRLGHGEHLCGRDRTPAPL